MSKIASEAAEEKYEAAGNLAKPLPVVGTKNAGNKLFLLAKIFSKQNI
jgi:hypothetical protein